MAGTARSIGRMTAESRATIAPKPSGPVCRNTLNQRQQSPAISGIFPCPNLELMPCIGCIVFGRDGRSGNARHMAGSMFRTSRPPTAIRKAVCGSSLNQKQPMPAPSASAPDQAEAMHAAAMARVYLRACNLPAARRQAVRLLQAIAVMEPKPVQTRANQALAAIKTVASKPNV